AAARLIRLTAPDVVHTHSAKAGLAGRLAVRGRIPTVHQPHAWSFEAVDGTAAQLVLRWERFATRWTTRLLCVSEAERSRGSAARVRAPWSVIGNGVDLDRFHPGPHAPGPRSCDPRDPAPRATAPRVTGLPAPGTAVEDAPLVVCVARLCPQKGQDVLLRAWPEVTRRVPGARLALVGDG
ncbi:glycosyltransferase, partial [Streptomyces sparsus]